MSETCLWYAERQLEHRVSFCIVCMSSANPMPVKTVSGQGHLARSLMATHSDACIHVGSDL